MQPPTLPVLLSYPTTRFNPHPPLMVDATRFGGVVRSLVGGFNPHPPLMVDATAGCGGVLTAEWVFQSPSTVDGGCNYLTIPRHLYSVRVSIPIHR